MLHSLLAVRVCARVTGFLLYVFQCINLSRDSPSKQEEAMELKQEVTKSDYIVVYISNYICLMRVCAELQYFFYMYFSVRISI